MFKIEEYEARGYCDTHEELDEFLKQIEKIPARIDTSVMFPAEYTDDGIYQFVVNYTLLSSMNW